MSPWAEYTLEVGPIDSRYTIIGHTPEGTDEVVITFSVGTVQAPVEPSGYFLTRQTFATTMPDMLIKIDALTDGKVTASQSPPFVDPDEGQ